jgi:hypothetical protein
VEWLKNEFYDANLSVCKLPTSTVGVPFVRVGKGSVECNRDCIICGSGVSVCKLEWVLGFWDKGVDMSHDKPFKALGGYTRECYRSVVI